MIPSYLVTIANEKIVSIEPKISHELTKDGKHFETVNWVVEILEERGRLAIKVGYYNESGRQVKSRKFAYAEGTIKLQQLPKLSIQSNLTTPEDMLEVRFGIAEYSNADPDGTFTGCNGWDDPFERESWSKFWVATDGELTCNGTPESEIDDEFISGLMMESCQTVFEVKNATWTVICRCKSDEQCEIGEKEITLRTSRPNVFLLAPELEAYLAERDLDSFESLLENFAQ